MKNLDSNYDFLVVGAGCYLSVQDWIHNLDPIDTSRTGNGESVKKDRQPITYAMIEKYIKLS